MGAEALSLTSDVRLHSQWILWKRVYTHNCTSVECVCVRVCGMYVYVWYVVCVWCVCGVV